MRKNYTKRLGNLRTRRYDEIRDSYSVSKSFGRSDIGESIRYTLEAMQDIQPEYTANTIKASEKVKNHLVEGLSKNGITVDFRNQGSVITNTHIMVHSDIDLLVFTKKFHGVKPPVPAIPPYSGNPLADMSTLRSSCAAILKRIYNETNDSGAIAIRVALKQPKRNVDVVMANWLDTQAWVESGEEAYRGIHFYDHNQKKRNADYPFLHIKRVKEKDERTGGSLRRLIRLLKVLCKDAEPEIALTGFDITSAMYAIADAELACRPGFEILLLNAADRQLGRLVSDATYRQELRSPNGEEYVFGQDIEKLKELKRLHLELAELMADIGEDLGGNNQYAEKGLIYS